MSRATGIIGCLLGLGLLAAVLAPATSAATPRRMWQAVFGSGTGVATISLGLDLTGAASVGQQSLTPSTAFSVEIYSHTCSAPKVVVRLPVLSTGTAGLGSLTTALTRSQGSAIWAASAAGAIAIRVSAGATARCATLTYPIATRVAISALNIDLPVVLQPGHSFPYCNVAMYVPSFSQPAEAGPTMLYAHARTGMFLPILTASTISNGASMVGMTIQVWTSNDLRYVYRVNRVWRHRTTVPPGSPAVQQLWLETSEGPFGTVEKMFLTATLISVGAASHDQSHPTPHRVVCGHYG
jgi:hypothetical protein